MEFQSSSLLADGCSYAEKILEVPEREDLLRLTAAVQHLFRVPSAYVELVDGGSEVVSRIGNPASGLSGAPHGGPEFTASATLIASSEVTLGSLVIADWRPRPDFSPEDAGALRELASALAAKMELRLIASQLRDSDLALRESGCRFRAIADSAPIPIICSGFDGLSTFVNIAWLDFTGRAMNEEIADGGFGCVHPESRRIVYEAYWRAFQAREPVTVEFPLRRHDGEYRWMRCRGLPRFREDGVFAGYVGTLVDLTEGRRDLP